jgi:ribosomal protein S18 acetylase RimI-like enzyme
MTSLETPPYEIALSIQFRLARQDDLPKLEWYGQYAHFRRVFRRAYKDQLSGKRLMLIADCGSFPIGQVFINITADPTIDSQNRRRAYFYSLRVMEMFRGKGIGSRLLNEAESRAVTYGYQWAAIAAAKDNPRARQLYERIGYHVFMEDNGSWSYIDHEGRTRHVYEPCWVLEKQIALR